MCGIAGFLSPSGPPSEAVLGAVGDCLAHRGPDSQGIFVDDPVTLAHRRLSIIDPERGNQPMFNEDGSVAITFNGEIYNHRELRAALHRSGHTFETNADTEVIVHGYEEWGDAVTERIRGMFAFGIWDATEKRLLLARDRMGIKPLLLAEDGKSVAFASELTALFETELSLGTLDRQAIALYFAFGFIPAPLTAFKNVTKLLPGERAVVTVDGVRRNRYYHPDVPTHEPGITEAADAIRHRVTDAVERRLMSDVPLGAFLSGGIDSSIVVGVMAELMDEPVQTFTVGFEEDVFDESWAANEVAAYHGTDHQTVTVTPDTVRKTVPHVLDKIGEPFADPSLIPTAVVSQETSRDVKVALSGDGADELFAGYEKHRGEYFSRYYRAIPGPARSNIIQPIIDSLSATRDSEFGEFVRKLQKFTRGGEPDLVTRHLDWLRFPDDRAIHVIEGIDVLAEAYDSLVDEHDAAAAMLPHNRQEDLCRMLAVDTRYSLPNQILRKVDRASMYHSLEVRVPFLDTGVVEYALSLPTGHKISARGRKRVLRLAFEDVLPESVLKRNKQGFDMPIGEWLKGPLSGEFRDMVRSVDAPHLDRTETMAIYDDHCTGRRDHERFCWAVYVYLRWLRRMREREILDG